MKQFLLWSNIPVLVLMFVLSYWYSGFGFLLSLVIWFVAFIIWARLVIGKE